jgi:DNA-binding GntR family transcriptional regulator
MHPVDSGSPRTAQQAAAEYLRSAILAGDLAPGARLAQSEIAAALRLSITPVREALRDLAMEGLVDIDRFRGAVVHVPTLSELEEIFLIRQRLIPLSSELGVARITEEELAESAALIAQMTVAADEVAWSILNRQFHRVLDNAARSPRLTEILRRLSDVATLYIHLTLAEEDDRRAEAEAEHRELHDAYGRRDADAATRLHLRHFEGTLRAARRRLMEPERGRPGVVAASPTARSRTPIR